MRDVVRGSEKRGVSRPVATVSAGDPQMAHARPFAIAPALACECVFPPERVWLVMA
jgi:hypothetical protein